MTRHRSRWLDMGAPAISTCLDLCRPGRPGEVELGRVALRNGTADWRGLPRNGADCRGMSWIVGLPTGYRTATATGDLPKLAFRNLP